MSFLFQEIERALDESSGSSFPAPEIQIVGEGALPSCFDVTGLAVASIAACGAELARLTARDRRRAPAPVLVDRRLASLWFAFSLRPLGWTLPSPWDPIAGDYATRDGWIRLHTNAPHHRQAALAVLGVEADRAAVAAAVARAPGEALETAIVERGGCAALMRSLSEWAEHPQGRAVAEEPLIAFETSPSGAPRPPIRAEEARPLAGLRVLDLTRVLAGPVATRLLAAFGAEVLRIDPPDWDEPAVVPEVTVGKRCARLDLTRADDRARFEALLADADVLVHGYRSDALERLDYDAVRRRRIAPNLIDVSLDAYGFRGPWHRRRGFDSLVQMSCGIAERGRISFGVERPTPLPVQALDHATGYLMAAAVLRGILLARTDGRATTARLSLARTAALLTSAPASGSDPALAAESPRDLASVEESTDWGAARRIRFPVRVGRGEGWFASPARALGSGEAAWSPDAP